MLLFLEESAELAVLVVLAADWNALLLALFMLERPLLLLIIELFIPRNFLVAAGAAWFFFTPHFSLVACIRMITSFLRQSSAPVLGSVL